MQHPNLDISNEVSLALKKNAPVVVLESTLISHGLPWPENLKTAQKLESVVRAAGATPATIAILGGRLKIGLNEPELNHLADPHALIQKVSRRDIPVLIAQQADGATTVAATMFIAALAKIAVFATGGIGGVHRGAENNFDISADLEELAQTNVAVICAGAKAILDLPLTLEYLETRSVPVIGYQTNEFPAFWSRQSGLSTTHRCDSPLEIAQVLNAKWSLGLAGGVVIANPVPVEHELNAKAIEQTITEALSHAERNQVSGKALTPYLLEKIRQLTAGASLNTNIQLVLNNAQLGAQLAIAWCKL